MKILTEDAGIRPAYDLSGLAPENEILFFDIETTGLRKESTQVYLIGCAYAEEETWRIRQYMAESALDEREILDAFCDFASGFRTLIHFNGDGFDIPYLAYKTGYYGMDFDFGAFQSFDIYKMAKPLKKLLCLERMNQKSIERFLHIERDDLYNGGALIPVYYEFERTGDPEAERLLLLHNYDDVKGMLRLCAVLNYLQIPEGDFDFSRLEIIGETAVFDYRMHTAVPVALETALDGGRILVSAENDLLQINVPIYRGIARLPLPDVENYYYLPEEDRVIHKDVAQFTDRKCRRKATAKNCFLKKDGWFLPQTRTLFEPSFLVEGEKKKTFFELEESVTEDHGILTEYALDILHM